jgi:hypothetical protein
MQLHESCELEMLPTSCGEPACARVVKLVADACGPMLSSSDFFSGFKEALDAAAHVCADVPAQRATYTMADPTLRLSPIVVSPGRVTDGMGVPGHWTATGQERVTIRAPAGQRVRFLLEAQWLGSHDVLILYDGVDENEKLAELRGTKLPADPLFISSGEEVRVLLVTADTGEGVATSFSALFDFICEDDAGCGGRGRCTEGRCNCPAGYFGDGCEDDSCVWKDCGANGICERGGTCRCMDGYSGEHCDFAAAYNLECSGPGSYHGQRETRVCGTFLRTAHMCDGVPAYQRADSVPGDDKSGPPALLRNSFPPGWYKNDPGGTHWSVTPGKDLAGCTNNGYLSSPTAGAGPPTAPGYSDGEWGGGWNGKVTVTAGRP